MDFEQNLQNKLRVHMFIDDEIILYELQSNEAGYMHVFALI